MVCFLPTNLIYDPGVVKLSLISQLNIPLLLRPVALRPMPGSGLELKIGLFCRQHRFLQWQEAKALWYAYLEHQLLCVVCARIETLVQVTVPKSQAAPSLTSILKIALVKFPEYAAVCQP
jgi:hypothetical protein